MTSPKVKTFEQTILLPAFDEVSKAPALLHEYSAEVVKHRPSVDANAEELLEALAGAMRRPAGPSLVLTNRTIPPDVSRLAGRYALTVFYDEDEDEVFASPAVLCGCVQPIEQAERGLERQAVPLAAVPREQEPRQRDVLVLPQVGQLVVRG